MTNRVRFTPKQLRLLAVGWIGLVALVGACTFLAIFFGSAPRADRNGSADDGETPAVGEVTVGPQGAATTAATPTLRPAVTPTDVPPGADDIPLAPTIPPAQDQSFGYGIQVQVHLNTEQTLDQVEQLGMGWIKQQIRWADLEPAQGQASWDALDQLFAATSQRNIKVMVSILDAPDWARSVTAEGKAGPPADPATYANYVGQFAQRYSGAVHAIEIWNEQNLDREWYTGGGLSATAYMEMLVPAANAIRQADPNIIIISGALAPTGVNDYVIAVDDFEYMQGMIDRGLLDNVDCVGGHANGINLPPWQSSEDALAQGMPPGYSFPGPFDNGNPLNPHHSWSFYSTLNGYHDLIVAAGRDTPLCITEFGWATIEGMDGVPKQSFEFAYDNTLQSQSQNIVQAFQLMHDWEFVWLAFLFNLDYSPKAGGNPQDDTTMFSITAGDGSPRPAYEAIRTMPKPP